MQDQFQIFQMNVISNAAGGQQDLHAQQAREMIKDSQGAFARATYVPGVGFATPDEAKHSRQYGWDVYRRI